MKRLSIRQIEQIAATEGHPQQQQAEAELWRRTPPPERGEEWTDEHGENRCEKEVF